MQQLNIDPHDAERMDDLEEECERYQILVHIFHCVVMLVILVKFSRMNHAVLFKYYIGAFSLIQIPPLSQKN